MRKTAQLCAISLVLALPALGQESSASSSPEPGSEEWFALQLAREASVRHELSKTNHSDRFSLEVPAKLLSETYDTDQGIHVLAYDIGATAPVRCFVWEQELDLGGILEVQSENIFGRVPGLVYREIHQTHSGAAGDAPTLGVDWLYRVEREQGSLVALSKIRTARKDSVTVYCMHDEMGYSQTYGDFFVRFVSSLQPIAEELLVGPPVFREILRLTADGVPLGVDEYSIYRTENGYREIALSSMLIAGEGGAVSSVDDARIGELTETGDLLEESETSASGLGVVTEVVLSRAGEAENAGGWRFEGTSEGAEIAGTVEGIPSSRMRQMHLLQSVNLQEAGGTAEMLIWAGAEAPSSLQPVKMTKLDDAANEDVEVQIEDMRLRGDVGLGGSVRRAQGVYQGLEVGAEQVFVRGAVPEAVDG